MFEYFFHYKGKTILVQPNRVLASSMMHPRAARHWTLRLVRKRPSKAARVSHKQRMLQAANDGIGESQGEREGKGAPKGLDSRIPSAPFHVLWTRGFFFVRVAMSGQNDVVRHSDVA